jgi:hypothetical protein
MAVRVPAHTMLCPTDSGEGEGFLAIRAAKMDRPYGPPQVMDGEGFGSLRGEQQGDGGSWGIASGGGYDGGGNSKGFGGGGRGS